MIFDKLLGGSGLSSNTPKSLANSRKSLIVNTNRASFRSTGCDDDYLGVKPEVENPKKEDRLTDINETVEEVNADQDDDSETNAFEHNFDLINF